MRDFKSVYESNLFVFKENLKVLVSQTIEYIWQQEIKNSNFNSFTNQEMNNGGFSEIIEVDEDVYHSNLVSKISIDKISQRNNKLKSFTENSNSVISNTQSIASHVDLDSDNAIAPENNVIEENNSSRPVIDRLKAYNTQKLKNVINNKSNWANKGKDMIEGKNLTESIKRRQSMKSKPINGISPQIPLKKHSLISFSNDHKFKDFNDVISNNKKKDKSLVVESLKSIKQNGNTIVKDNKVKTSKNTNGWDDIKTAYKTESRLHPIKFDKVVKEVPTERRANKIKEIMHRINKGNSQNGSNRDLDDIGVN